VKRFQFFAALLGAVGIGKAQQWSAYADGCRDIFCKDRKAALNNQCPVCGTMAERLKFTDSPAMAKEILSVADSSGKITQRVWIVRCKRCNAAFWQDAEK
jgi:rRNA maturation endonuclease Nob1